MITRTHNSRPPSPWTTLADEGSPRVARHVPPSTRRVVGQFIAASLLAALLLVIASVLISRDAAKDESIADARHTTDVVARAVVEPVLRNSIVTSNPAAVAALNRAIKGPIVGASAAVRVKIWTASGWIVYSDEPKLIGQHYTLRADELRTLKDGGTDAELSDLSRPENRFERSDGSLLEVYKAVHTPNGTPLLFETYSRYTAVTSRSGAIWLKFAPLTIGVLLLLQLVQLPLARRMTRQLREGQTEREDLLRKAADASADERRRIAGTLHDGVVQDLAGASFIVAGAIDHLASTARSNGGTGRTAASLRPALSAIRESIGGLRAMLVDIYPPSLRSAGLTVALSDLTAPLAGRGIDVHSDIQSGIDLPAETEQLIFRVAQESLRNVSKHAQARAVNVQLLKTADHVVLVIADDGIGFDVASHSQPHGAGHFGLQVLSDLATSAGASLEISSAADAGSWLRLRVPLA
jgi:two-component system NarL family sensor kinase